MNRELRGVGTVLSYVRKLGLLPRLTLEARVPGIDQAKFKEIAEQAKAGCPVSKALAGVEISLDAKLA